MSLPRVSISVFTLALCLFVIASPATTQETKPDPRAPYLNHRLPLDQRVDDLVSRMTLDEKVSQMMNAAPAIPRLGIPQYDWWNEALLSPASRQFSHKRSDWEPHLMRHWLIASPP
jgi:beta-glucosidase